LLLSAKKIIHSKAKSNVQNCGWYKKYDSENNRREASGSSKNTNEALHPLRLDCVAARVKGGGFYCWGCVVDALSL
jgi:hypothetical protein